MNFEILTNIKPENISKFLIFFHVLEVFEKSFLKSVDSGEIICWPAATQIQMTKISSWWKIRKAGRQNLDLDDKKILIEILNLWEFIK